MKLTKEIINQLFSECEWPKEEWPNERVSIEEAPDVARLLLPLPNGENAIGFHPDKLLEYSNTIGELLDQVPYLSCENGISFSMLGYTQEGAWTQDNYEIQKLYLLGVVTDQLLALPINGKVVIGRIPKTKSIVDIVSVDEKGKSKLLAKKLGEKYFFPKDE